MTENSAVTKEDLQNVVIQLSGLIKDTANNLKTEITAEMDRRFDESKNDMTKRFRRAERKQQTFQKEVENQFHEIRSMAENRFDMARKYTDDEVVKKIREVITMLDGQAGMARNLEIEQKTLGVLHDQLERDLEASNKSNGAAIADLKQRVNTLEEKVLAEPAK